MSKKHKVPSREVVTNNTTKLKVNKISALTFILSKGLDRKYTLVSYLRYSHIADGVCSKEGQ